MDDQFTQSNESLNTSKDESKKPEDREATSADETPTSLNEISNNKGDGMSKKGASSKKSNKQSIIPQEESIVERLKKLMDIVKVQKVYYIDDANCKEVDVDVFLGKINFCYNQENVAEKLNKVKIEGVEFTEPYDIVSTIIKEKWSQVEEGEKIKLFKELNEAVDDKHALHDYTITPKIKEYFSEGILESLDPFEWEKIIGEVDSQIESGNKVLVIFDQTLKDAGGKFSVRTGIDLIIALKDTPLKHKAICALLTNEILSPEQELYYRKQIVDSKDKAIDDWDFFPLSKQRLDVPEVFADGIKKTFINKPFEIIKHETINIVRKSHEKAFDRIRNINTYIFDDAVIKSSFKEGVWEIETLLRIIEIYQKDQLYQAMVDDSYFNKINPEIKCSLEFSDIKFEIPANYKPYTDKAKMRHKELYQSGELINALHKPIENGDIFKIGDLKFILVAQPCDMMVRAVGAKVGRRNAKYVTLLKIDTISNEDYKKKNQNKSLNNFLLNRHALFYLDELGAEVAVALFNETIVVDVDILDLIVYNNEGNCIYNFNDKNFDLKQYNTAWIERFNYLKEKVQVFKAKIDTAHTNVKNDIENRDQYLIENFYPKLVVSSTLPMNNTITYNNTIFNFNIQRIFNYKNLNATYLLDRYMRYLSRAAELHDFAS